MKQELWRRVEAVFHGALERKQDARQTFLNEICGSDIDLRHQVELLLANEGQAGFLIHNSVLSVYATLGHFLIAGRIIPLP